MHFILNLTSFLLMYIIILFSLMLATTFLVDMWCRKVINAWLNCSIPLLAFHRTGMIFGRWNCSTAKGEKISGRAIERRGFGNCQQPWSLIHWNPNGKTPGSQKWCHDGSRVCAAWLWASAYDVNGVGTRYNDRSYSVPGGRLSKAMSPPMKDSIKAGSKILM